MHILWLVNGQTVDYTLPFSQVKLTQILNLSQFDIGRPLTNILTQKIKANFLKRLSEQ